MAPHIINPEVESTVRAVEPKRGETITQTLVLAVKELERIREIQDRVAAMPELDPRPADEIIGYNEFGCFD
jgi:hypothetical protein